MGGAQPLAATFAGACSLNIECQQSRIDFRLRSALPRRAGDRPRRRAGAHREATRPQKKAVSIGLLGNAAEILPELVQARAGGRHEARPGDRPDQRARPRQRLPAGRLERRALAGRAGRCRRSTPRCATPRRRAARCTCRRCSTSRPWACPTVDYGNNIRQVAFDAGVKNAFDFPGFVPAYIRPLFCRGKGPFRWVALSRRPGRHPQDRRQDEGAVPRRRAPAPLARHGRRAHRLPGPAGAHLLDRPGRAPPRRPGLQRDGEVAAS